jgi:hypothetical protein
MPFDPDIVWCEELKVGVKLHYISFGNLVALEKSYHHMPPASKTNTAAHLPDSCLLIPDSGH